MRVERNEDEPYFRKTRKLEKTIITQIVVKKKTRKREKTREKKVGKNRKNKKKTASGKKM